MPTHIIFKLLKTIDEKENTENHQTKITHYIQENNNFNDCELFIKKKKNESQKTVNTIFKVLKDKNLEGFKT